MIKIRSAMIFWNAIFIGLKEIWAHKFRSLLTMLGVVLGVSSLVTMAAIVKGMENGMKESMIAMGGVDKIRITDERVPEYQEHLRDQAPGKRIRDVIALRENASLLKLISPEMGLRTYVSRAGKYTRPSELVGVWPAVLEMNLFEVEHGRFFTDLDEELANSVCVIGTGIRDELFGAPEETGDLIIPIGETINIKDQPFTIVGMFKHYESEQTRKIREAAEKAETKEQDGPKRRKGWRSRRWDAFWRKNNTVYIPLNTMWVKFRSASGEEGAPEPILDDIDIKIKDIERLEESLQQARNILMVTHNGIEDFEFRTQESRLDDINERIRNARLSGGLVAALSLLVGGIGIMNIMLASINERIREIGTCKALGATHVTIFTQVLVESVVLAVLGGLVGLAAAYGLVQLVEMFSVVQDSPGYTQSSTGNSPVITTGAMLLAMGFSAFVGVVAGLFPAWKAARFDPIRALRYE